MEGKDGLSKSLRVPKSAGKLGEDQTFESQLKLSKMRSGSYQVKLKSAPKQIRRITTRRQPPSNAISNDVSSQPSMQYTEKEQEIYQRMASQQPDKYIPILGDVIYAGENQFSFVSKKYQFRRIICGNAPRRFFYTFGMINTIVAAFYYFVLGTMHKETT